MAQRYILAGHSHAIAFGMPTPPKSGEVTLAPVGGFDDVVLGLTGPFPRQVNYWDALLANAENSKIFLIWGGNQHLARFLFESTPEFDFYTAAHPDIPVSSAAVLVPETLVRHDLDRGNVGLKPLLKKLCCVANCTPVVVGTPPPKGNDRRLRSLLYSEEHFSRAAESLGLSLDDITLTKPLVRRKLWLVIQDLLRESAIQAGCEFFPVPAEAMNDSGFLREDLWREDVTHANEEYGDLIWKLLLPPGRVSR